MRGKLIGDDGWAEDGGVGEMEGTNDKWPRAS